MKKIDLAISFDDTGSMSSVRKIVRSKISEFMKSLFSSEIDLRIGLVSQNDYCDPQPTILQDFTKDENILQKFIEQPSVGGGGDFDECYELVLDQVLNFNWREDAVKCLIMIGDCNPHEKGYKCGSYSVNFDWRTLLPKYKEQDIRIYGVKALSYSGAEKFYTTISNQTGGIKVNLDQLADIQQFIMAIFHKENGTLEEYENSESLFKTKITFKNMFSRLKNSLEVFESIDEAKRSTSGLSSLSKFQVIPVDRSCRIDEFVRGYDLSYKAGKGFYEWTMSEKIQGNKQIIFQDRESGEIFEDSLWCREQLGLTYGVAKTLSPRGVPEVYKKYRVYIQSNSYTRNMDVGTTFLYEIEMK